MEGFELNREPVHENSNQEEETDRGIVGEMNDEARQQRIRVGPD